MRGTGVHGWARGTRAWSSARGSVSDGGLALGAVSTTRSRTSRKRAAVNAIAAMPPLRCCHAAMPLLRRCGLGATCLRAGAASWMAPRAASVACSQAPPAPCLTALASRPMHACLPFACAMADGVRAVTLKSVSRQLVQAMRSLSCHRASSPSSCASCYLMTCDSRRANALAAGVRQVLGGGPADPRRLEDGKRAAAATRCACVAAASWRLGDACVRDD